jgi:transposase
MIPHGVEIFLSVDTIDLRWGFDRLAGLAQERAGVDARSGALFVFFGKRRTGVKVLFCDGTGMCLFYKRLDRGVFRGPVSVAEGAASITLSERELEDLLDGIDVEALPKRSRRPPPVH